LTRGPIPVSQTTIRGRERGSCVSADPHDQGILGAPERAAARDPRHPCQPPHLLALGPRYLARAQQWPVASYGFDTLQIHAGARPDPATGARQTPIYQTTAYVFRDADHAAALFNLQEVGFIYSRLTNPTVAVLQERIATLEGGVGAVCCSSGHAAQIMALFPLMGAGAQHRRLDPALWRHGHPVQPDDQALRLVGPLRRFRRSRRGRPRSTTTRARSSAKPSPIRAATSPIFRPSPGSPTGRACR
jgi:cystathionine beta-lyase/cystathionine gamma-synthase